MSKQQFKRFACRAACAVALAGIGLFLLGILCGDRVERSLLRRIRRNAA